MGKKNNRKESEMYIYGVTGLAEFLGVCRTTACRIKKANIFPYYGYGRTTIFKIEEVLAGMAKKSAQLSNSKVHDTESPN